MVLIKEAPRETFFHALLGGDEIDENFQKILGHSVNNRGLYIMDPWWTEDHAYITPKGNYGELVG